MKVSRKYRATYKLWLKIKAELEVIDAEFCQSVFTTDRDKSPFKDAVPFPVINIGYYIRLVLYSNYIEMQLYPAKKSVEIHQGRILMSNDINPFVCDIYIDEAIEKLKSMYKLYPENTNKCDKIAEILKKYFCEREGA